MKVTWRDPYPGETMLGGRGIVIPFRYNVPDKDEPASSPDPTVAENPEPQGPETMQEQ